MRPYSQDRCNDFVARATLGELSQWCRNNPTYMTKNIGTILNRLFHMKVWVTHRNGEPEYCTMSDINDFVNMILHRSVFGSSEFDLLNVVANNIYTPDYKKLDLEDESVNIRNKAILLSLIDSDKIKNNVDLCFGETKDLVTKTFYQMIIDVYIPTEDPEEMILEIMDCLKLREIIKNEGDTEWVMQTLLSKSEVNSINVKEIVLFCKILADIYRNQESAMEFLKLYHKMYNKEFWIKGEVITLVDRYNRYFDDPDEDGYLFVSTLFGLMSDDNVWRSFQKIPPNANPMLTITNEVESFLLDYSSKMNKRGMTQEILKSLISEIWNVINRHDSYNVKRDRCAFVSNKILSLWGNPKYEVSDIEKTVDEDNSPPISTLESYTQIAIEAIHKDSVAMNSAEKKIYKAYKTYKEAEEKVDSQITKAVNDLKTVATGDVRSEIIEGKKFTALGLLKRVLGTVGLFSIGPMKAVIALVVKYALKKKTTESEKRKIILEIDTELEMLEEKIQDARGDNNREAKYSMMRTKKELENAKTRIMYGMEADDRSLSDTKAVLNNSRNERTV